MRTFAFVALIPIFVLSTISLGADDGDACNNCDAHTPEDERPHEAPGHAHGDSDDDHETPDSPCHHNKSEFHCCCSHTQAMIGVAAAEIPAPVVGIPIVLESQDIKLDPLLRQTFHIPIA